MNSPQLRLRFDPDQEHQRDAVSSVVRLFDGLARADAGSFRLLSESEGAEDVIPNLPQGHALEESWLHDNLGRVQAENRIQSDVLAGLAVDEGLVLEGAGSESWRYPSFTIEMETGTGKTYVYLRTILELRKRFGFGKFVIVVPSIAIYEGVIKNFSVTRAHFAAMYGNEPINLVPYDGNQVSALRGFATSTFCEVLLITLDGFNKANGRSANNIYKMTEKLPGERRPVQFVQQTRPILILDEPQNMESETARAALRTLHPLFALRYSATHRTSPNLLYRLSPFEAYRQNLVKRIQVAGVTEVEDLNSPFLTLDGISQAGKITAKVRTHAFDGRRALEKEVTLEHGTDLYAKTKRPEHENGCVVREIHRGEGWLEFTNGLRLSIGDTVGRQRPEVFRAQIRETIKQHFERQFALREQGIKVLSLFFVDRVASYVAEDGLVRQIFDDEYRKLSRAYGDFAKFRPEDVRRAYFATKREKGGEGKEVDIGIEEAGRRKDERELAKAAFDLIMKDKERLLSFVEPVAFIFAHSALKEGWDNPNVFQICTLNQTVSETKKRQEIGRGLRLCVNQNGERVHGEEVNVLTVVANQSYDSYARQLQAEYVSDGDAEGAPPRVSNAHRRKAKRRDSLYRAHPDFDRFWSLLSQRIDYSLVVDSEVLVAECIEQLDRASYPKPKVVVQKGDFVVHRYTMELLRVRGPKARLKLVAERTDTPGRDIREWEVKQGDSVGRAMNDERLRDFKVLEVYPALPEPRLVFENAVELYTASPQVFESAEGQQMRSQDVRVADQAYPVMNLVQRAATATGLTRRTLGAMFRGMKPEKKGAIVRNPEGFASVFIATISEALAKHVSARLAFNVVDGLEEWDLDELFPAVKEFAQKELEPAGDSGLYDFVQQDSGVEKTFIERLKADSQVVIYFKFPPSFKVRLPKLIGNYNPDWGIVRQDDNGRVSLHLVRETKGTENLDALRFPHEQRKIECARKYFSAAGLDYRPIAGDTTEWWLPWPSETRLRLL